MMCAQFLFEAPLAMRPPRAFQLPVLLSLAAVAGGCGDSGSPAGSADTRGVVASAGDCVSFGPGAVEACAAAIERAVTRHEESTTAYTAVEDCEAVVGEGKCERSASGKYRPRLSAFMVTLGPPARAEPLYPTNDGTVGFLTANKSKVPASDRSLGFSRLALSVAEMQAGQDKKARRSRF